MKLALSLPADVSIALRKFSLEQNQLVEEAVANALRNWLVGQGLLETKDLDEDSETVGNA